MHGYFHLGVSLTPIHNCTITIIKLHFRLLQKKITKWDISRKLISLCTKLRSPWNLAARLVNGRKFRFLFRKSPFWATGHSPRLLSAPRNSRWPFHLQMDPADPAGCLMITLKVLPPSIGAVAITAYDKTPSHSYGEDVKALCLTVPGTITIPSSVSRDVVSWT